MTRLVELISKDPEAFERRWKALQAARGVLADLAHHTDADIRVAARTVYIYSPDEAESAEGLAMLQLVMKRQHRAGE